MPAYRYYCPHLQKTSQPCIEGSEFEHLSKVMRQKEGDHVELVDGHGILAYASLSSLEKKRALFNIEKKESYSLTYSLVLYQALTTWSHLEWIVEKSVELGATELIFFESTHTPFAISDKKQERLQLKAIGALKQSGRVFLPKMSFKNSLKEVCLDHKNAYFGDLRPNAPVLNLQEKKEGENSFAFASGPESGFTAQEHIQLEEKGFKGARIHSNILRAETAPLSFLSIAHHTIMLKSESSLIN